MDNLWVDRPFTREEVKAMASRVNGYHAGHLVRRLIASIQERDAALNHIASSTHAWESDAVGDALTGLGYNSDDW